jgi:hypothetical protein
VRIRLPSVGLPGYWYVFSVVHICAVPSCSLFVCCVRFHSIDGVKVYMYRNSCGVSTHGWPVYWSTQCNVRLGSLIYFQYNKRPTCIFSYSDVWNNGIGPFTLVLCLRNGFRTVGGVSTSQSTQLIQQESRYSDELRTGRPGFDSRFSLLHIVQTSFEAHPASCPMVIGVVKLTTHLHLVPSSRMVELYLHSPHVFMA